MPVTVKQAKNDDDPLFTPEVAHDANDYAEKFVGVLQKIPLACAYYGISYDPDDNSKIWMNILLLKLLEERFDGFKVYHPSEIGKRGRPKKWGAARQIDLQVDIAEIKLLENCNDTSALTFALERQPYASRWNPKGKRVSEKLVASLRSRLSEARRSLPGFERERPQMTLEYLQKFIRLPSGDR